MTLPYIPHIPRKPASIKEAAFGRLPQRGRAASRPAPFVGNPLWRLAFGGYVGYRAMSRQKDSLLKDCLLKCRSHFKRRSFKKGSCAAWNYLVFFFVFPERARYFCYISIVLPRVFLYFTDCTYLTLALVSGRRDH